MFTNEEYKALTFEQKKEVMAWKAKFHSKKSKATAEMKRIGKNGYNKFHNYYYAQESDVKDAVREILRENQLSVTSDLVTRTETAVKTKQGDATKTDVKMDFTLTDCETGYFEIYSLDGVAIDTGDKGSYKAYTTTIKYFLMNEFLIPTGDDVEIDSHTQSGNDQQKQNQQPKQNQQQKTQSQNQQRPQNQQPNQQKNTSGDQKKPTWRKILDAEDLLAEASGRKKYEVKNSLENHFDNYKSNMKYKDMDEDMAVAILNTLNGWIAQYTKN